MNIKNMNLKTKIFILLFVSIFIPTASLSVLTYYQAQKAIRNTITNSISSELNSEIMNLDASLNAALEINNKLVNEKELIDIASKTNKFTDNEKSESYAYVYKLLNQYILRIKAPNILTSIDSYYLYLVNQNTVITTNSTYYEDIDIENISFMSQMADKHYIPGWFITDSVDYQSLADKNNSKKLITYARPIYDVNGKLVAVSALNINEEWLNSKLSSLGISIKKDIFVCDANNNIVFSNGMSDIKSIKDFIHLNSFSVNTQGGYKTRFSDRPVYTVFNSSTYTNWRYYVLVDYSAMTSTLLAARTFLVIALLFSVFVVFLVSTLLSSWFYNPIKRFVIAMKQIRKGDLKVRIEDNRTDEFKELYDGFNKMTGDLDKVINDLSTEKLLNQEAYIKLLQEQINPHFIYNTMESISSIAVMENVPIISKMVIALSRFYRISLSEGKNFVEFNSAIELVESYLTVQNIRFNNKFTVQMDINNSLRKYLVPKLILQPFVENAIYHGFASKKNNCKIIISALEDKDMLIITVADNGCGMTQTKLDELNRMLSGDKERDGNFAIWSMNKQLKIRFGDECGISVDSRENCYTIITVTLPAVDKMSELEDISLIPLT